MDSASTPRTPFPDDSPKHLIQAIAKALSERMREWHLRHAYRNRLIPPPCSPPHSAKLQRGRRRTQRGIFYHRDAEITEFRIRFLKFPKLRVLGFNLNDISASKMRLKSFLLRILTGCTKRRGRIPAVVFDR